MGLDALTDPVAVLFEARHVWAPGIQSNTVRREVARALPVAAVLATATLLRVWNINGLGFNTDEAVYAGQAASIANDPTLQQFFPIFRAHPLLFQMVLSIVYQFGVSDLVGRLLSAMVGIATVGVTYLLGRLLYGQRVGLVCSMLLATMPYHVVVTRQVLLDGPSAFFTTLALYLIARYATTERPIWLYGAGSVCGLALLSKETSVIVTLGGIYAFFALVPSIRLNVKDLVISLVCFGVVVAPFPLTLTLAGRASTGKSYLIWQLFRRPNHDLSFYATILPGMIGPLVIAAAIVGLWALRRERTWREVLLVTWVVVPLGFFELWPVKGFQYPLPIAPAVVVLAGRAIDRLFDIGVVARRPWRASRGAVITAAAAVVVASLVVPTWQQIQSSAGTNFLAGTGGVPGGRELGAWIQQNVPEDAKMLAIGPSMANIVEFYGHRKAYGLSVSPNPLHRNPSYDAIENPDFAIRNNDIQYVVWDSYSAGRSAFFEQGLLRFTTKYNGRIVHTETVRTVTRDGNEADVPVIVVYEVRP